MLIYIKTTTTTELDRRSPVRHLDKKEIGLPFLLYLHEMH